VASAGVPKIDEITFHFQNYEKLTKEQAQFKDRWADLFGGG
jgi:hypothetical protein